MAVGEAHRYSSGPPQPKADRSWCIHTANIKCIIINNKPRRRQQQGAGLQWPAYCAVSLHTGNRSSNPSAISHFWNLNQIRKSRKKPAQAVAVSLVAAHRYYSHWATAKAPNNLQDNEQEWTWNQNATEHCVPQAKRAMKGDFSVIRAAGPGKALQGKQTSLKGLAQCLFSGKSRKRRRNCSK